MGEKWLRMNKPGGPKEYMESRVSSLGAGFCDETVGGRAGPAGVEHGGLCGVRLEVVCQGRLGAQLEVL